MDLQLFVHKVKKTKQENVSNMLFLSENYNSVKTFLDTLKYDEYGWQVIVYFKIVAFLMGLQGHLDQFSLLSLSSGQNGHQDTLPHAGLATVD